MPTFAPTPRFRRDYQKLTAGQRERFRKIVITEFAPDAEARRSRSGLRVKGVQGAPGVYEMTWAPDGRATWQYGEEQRPGVPHVIWRRVGTHAIFDAGPPQSRRRQLPGHGGKGYLARTPAGPRAGQLAVPPHPAG